MTRTGDKDDKNLRANRRDRLAEELRANLKRRKSRGMGMEKKEGKTAPRTGEDESR